LYLAKNTFDLGSLAVTLDAMAVAFSAEATDEIVGIIDEKHGVGDVAFLGRPGERLASNRDCICRNSRQWRLRFVAGSTAAYSQY